jgi:Ni/Fe-hydrogenase 1 B-type cytochrome subunit
MIKKVYVWEFPVRLTHWLNFLTILTLAITGFYIGAPFIRAIHENQFIMAQFRFVHFVAAYVFAVSVLVRIYWWFVGNRYSHWDQFLPISEERRKNLYGTAEFYCFLREKCPEVTGHTGIAGLTYFLLFMLFLLEILTGFALYSQSHAGGIRILMGGWLLSVISEGAIRLIHHCIMWVIAVFLILHIYIGWHNDIMERNGLMSSIFSGYKSIEKKN